MSMTTAAETAKGLSTEEWAALEYIQTNGSYLINDEDNSLNNFDRVFLKGLLNKIYNQDSPRYFLNVYGRAVLEARASVPVAGKPATVTAETFYRETPVAEGRAVISTTIDQMASEALASGLADESIQMEIASAELAGYTPPQPAAAQPVSEPAAGSGADEPQTQAELCEREIVKIRSLTLKDDEYTGDLLAYAVGSPVGITMCVEARMKQIADLQEEIKRLKKQIKKLNHKSNLDDGFIDYLTQESEE